MTLSDVIDTLQTWIRNADDEYDREEMGRVSGLKEALHEIKKIEPCEDAISREEALKAVDKKIEQLSKDEVFIRKHGAIDVIGVKNYLLALPPVTPQPKTGHWIDDTKYGGTECSECGKWYPHATIAKNEIKYCSECGAKMEVEE